LVLSIMLFLRQLIPGNRRSNPVSIVRISAYCHDSKIWECSGTLNKSPGPVINFVNNYGTRTLSGRETGASMAKGNHAGRPIWADNPKVDVGTAETPCRCSRAICYLAKSSQTITTADSSFFGPIVSKRQQKKSPRRAAASGSSWPEYQRIFAHFHIEKHRPTDFYGERCGKGSAENPQNCCQRGESDELKYVSSRT
jgi:hypothetical protein